MKNSLMLVFSFFLLTGLILPAYAQTTDDHIVINEVDTNPPGNDAETISEWVEIYNPTDSEVDLGNWKIASTTVLKKTMTISEGTMIKPGQFLTFSYQPVWFTDSGDSIELLDPTGALIDKTPTVTDVKNDFTSWQRIYDAYDSDNSDDWKFVTSTAGSSNGKLVLNEDVGNVFVTISSEKDSYVFGEVAVLKGSISEEVFVYKPFFQPEQIVVDITGPDFFKTLTLYPDLNKNFQTTLSLHQILGINEGSYDVSVEYAGATSSTTFSVGMQTTEKEEIVDSALTMTTDKSQYIPGQSVSIIATSSEIIPFEGMTFTITDPDQKVIANGNLFPVDGEFTTSVYIATVNPAFGTYQINAEYNEKSIQSTFDVVEDLKEDVSISLWTDKTAYELGEQVHITGRLNQVWIATMNLEILQTKQTSIGSSSTGSDTGFKILDGVTIEGDGSFSYSFIVPDNNIRLGTYQITVSQDIGSASTVIHAVSDPGDFVASAEPITLNSDKQVYEIGDTMTLNGFIEDPFGNSSYTSGTPVRISITHEDGTPLEIVGLSSGSKTRHDGGVIVSYDFTAVPEASGSFATRIDIPQNIFTEGGYIVTAQYLGDVVTLSFSVVDPLSLTDGAQISLDKEVYGLGESLSLVGIIPPSGASTVDISLTKPDGTVINSGSTVDNQRFSWSWMTPIAEKVQNIKTDDGRDVIKSNFGVYKIKVSTDSFSQDLFFKVSSDPENDSLSTEPIFVTTEKSLYKAGEKLKVEGNVIKRDQGDEGLVVPERVTIQVLDGEFPYPQIHESSVYPDQGGYFSSLFELPPTVFSEGSYAVKALYLRTQTETTFSVANDFAFGSDEPVSLLLATDKSEYHPGETVTITGKPNKLIYLEEFDVSVIQKSDSEITCGSFYCGEHVGPVVAIRPGPSGSFTHQFVIDESSSSLGLYEITVDADFETKSLSFNVVEKPELPILSTLIDKENRISEQQIPILVEAKTSNGVLFEPRVLSGSMITSSRGEESNVNLQVSTFSGACVIGSDESCLISDSTRQPGKIYEIVEVDGVSLNVRYSGPDVRLEKFSILPESSDEFLPDTIWNVEIIKDGEQVSRFYYKITYKLSE